MSKGHSTLSTRPQTAREPIYNFGFGETKGQPKMWNKAGYAPTSAETNYLGGPWFRDKLALARLRSPSQTARTPQKPVTPSLLPPLALSPRGSTGDGRWPYRAESHLMSTNRTGTGKLFQPQIA